MKLIKNMAMNQIVSFLLADFQRPIPFQKVSQAMTRNIPAPKFGICQLNIVLLYTRISVFVMEEFNSQVF